MKQSSKRSTQAIWAGEGEDLHARSTQVPVFLGVSYHYDDLDTWHDVALEKEEGHIYSRNTNPTLQALETKVAALEGAEEGTSFATGMAAISNTLMTLLSPGERVVSVKDTYGGTNKIFNDILPRFNVDVMLCETTDHEMIEAEIDKGCKMVYLETPTNPTLKVLDIERLVKKAKEVDAIVVIDNTFATPINQNPLDMGVDLVIHSATKFLGGHADALGGILCGRSDLVKQVFNAREIQGATLGAMSAYLLIRGLKTLSLRIERQNYNAQKVAEYLESHPKVEDVFYPGLKSHPQHEVAAKQMRGFGGMLSFSLKGDDFEKVKTCMTSLNYAFSAANLGSVETIVGPPRTSSHVELTAEERARAGIPESLIRYSTGIEDVEDLIADLEQALQKV